MGGFNGSGIFVRSFSWQQDAANGTNILAASVDTEDNGFATGLSNCVTRDGQGKMGVDFLPATDNAFALGSAIRRWGSFNGVPAAAVTPSQAVKAALTARASNTTNSDDPDLTMALGVGTWRIEAQIFFNAIASGSTPGFKGGFHFSGTCNTCLWQITGSANLASFNSVVAGFTGANGTAVNTFQAAANPFVDGLTFVGVLPITVAGTLAFSWAQFQSSSNATQVLANSYLSCRRLS